MTMQRKLWRDLPAAQQATPEWFRETFTSPESRARHAERALAGEHTGCPVAVPAWTSADTRADGERYNPCALTVQPGESFCHVHGGAKRLRPARPMAARHCPTCTCVRQYAETGEDDLSALGKALRSVLAERAMARGEA